MNDYNRGITIRNSNTPTLTEVEVENRADHRETRLMKSEWIEIKKLVEKINIVVPKLDLISLLSGSAISTMISGIIGIIQDLEEKIFSTETVTYLGITIILGIIIILIYSCGKSEKNLNEAKIHSDYLRDKIKTIDERIASDIE